MSRVTILYQDKSIEIQANPGEMLLIALQRAGVPVHAPCGGRGHCRKCRVKLTQDGHTRPVLACLVQVTGDCSVQVPTMGDGRIMQGGSMPPPAPPMQAMPWGPPPQGGQWGPPPGFPPPGQGRPPRPPFARPGYGIAVDLGTTTVVVQLYALNGGKTPLGSTGAWNAQATYGADVISRTQYIMSHDDGLQTLSSVIRNQVMELGYGLCRERGVNPAELCEAVIAGNTIMQHIFAGIDPSSIAVAPYTPVTLFVEDELYRFPECPNVAVRFAPCVAGYVGGDIISGLLYCELTRETQPELFLDIGTNGEMALYRDGRFFCCSVASGPAFEGAEISCGMSSHSGAISHVSWQDNRFMIEVIDDTEPVGICGSGLVDLLAILLELEIVDETGRLLPPDEAPEEFADYLTEDENGNGIFHLTPEVSFCAADVRKLQLAKAAVAAGVEILLNQAGITEDEVDILFVAGGFGDNLRPESAGKIGLLPERLVDKIFCVGNSSMSGVRQILINPQRRSAMLEIQQRCTYLELSGNQEFSDAFIDHMMFE